MLYRPRREGKGHAAGKGHQGEYSPWQVKTMKAEDVALLKEIERLGCYDDEEWWLQKWFGFRAAIEYELQRPGWLRLGDGAWMADRRVDDRW